MTTVTKTALFDATNSSSNMRKADAFMNVSIIQVDEDGNETEYKLPKGLAMHLATAREAKVLKHSKANPNHVYQLRGTIRFVEADGEDDTEVTFK